MWRNTQTSDDLQQVRILPCAQFLGESRMLARSSLTGDGDTHTHTHTLSLPFSPCFVPLAGAGAGSEIIPTYCFLPMLLSTYRGENSLWSPFCQQPLPSCTVVPGASEMTR